MTVFCLSVFNIVSMSLVTCQNGLLFLVFSRLFVVVRSSFTLAANSRIHAIKVLLTSTNTGIGACLLRFIGNGLDYYCDLGVMWIGTKHEIASG